jgi:hypothetical protein
LSVEAFVLAALVDEGTPKKAFQAGISREDFEMHEEEWDWIISRAEKRKPITPRLFKQAFPEFDFIIQREPIPALIEELKKERAYVSISSGIDDVLADLDQENAVEKAAHLREILGEVLKLHAPNSDVLIKSGWQAQYQRAKELAILRTTGHVPGIQTGINHFDHHFGGLLGATAYLFLGRPGDAKSMVLGKLATEGAWGGWRMGFFSPEMTEHQHNCRFHTLLSAKREVQQAVGLKGAFRNRALKDGYGFNIKTYRNFLEYIDRHMPGEIVLFTQKYRREKMTPAFIESKIDDLGLDAIIVDPIYKLRSPKKRGTRWEELNDIVDALVDIAHTHNIPVILSNQANRALVGRRDGPPDKNSSFGADSPVQEANAVIGVRNYPEERVLRFDCSKNRDGEQFKFSARFVPNIGVLEDVTPIKGDYLNGHDPEKVAELHEAIKKHEKAKLASA